MSQALAIEMYDNDTKRVQYATVHKLGCKDLRDPESIGTVATRADIDAAVMDTTGWSDSDGEEYPRIAPCVHLPKH